MGRAPCCEKMGLKKGPWTAEEDHILINYINRYGHGNWRALPKQAGLLRCGKSCRLRWTNYLRPDIKRGNFSKEEEETIIKLHQMMGNRWSAIAARLPGRTDNEIKNVWHTHLKKRLLKQNETALELLTNPPESIKMEKYDQVMDKKPKPMNYTNQVGLESPQRSASDTSSVVTTTTTTSDNTTTVGMNDDHDSLDNFPEVDENFWSDLFLGDDDSEETSNFPVTSADQQVQFQFQLSSPLQEGVEYYCGNNSSLHDGMDYWFNMYTTAGELPELPEF